MKVKREWLIAFYPDFDEIVRADTAKEVVSKMRFGRGSLIEKDYDLIEYKKDVIRRTNVYKGTSLEVPKTFSEFLEVLRTV